MLYITCFDCLIRLNYIFTNNIQDTWNSQWKSSEKGKLTQKLFFPNVAERLKWKFFSPNFITTQLFMSGHGKFASYLQRFNINNETGAQCICGDEQTVDHLLFTCPVFETRRIRLVAHIMNCNMDYQEPIHQIFKKNCCYKSFVNFIHQIYNKL